MLVYRCRAWGRMGALNPSVVDPFPLPLSRTFMIVTAYSTLRRPFELDFPCEKKEMKARENTDLESHLNAVMGWACDGGGIEMSSTLFAVLQHLERTHQLVSI